MEYRSHADHSEHDRLQLALSTSRARSVSSNDEFASNGKVALVVLFEVDVDDVGNDGL